MKSGNLAVSRGLLLFVAFMATDAGHVHEDGTGALWIAPELVDTPPAQFCSQSASLTRQDVVFERLELDELDVASLPAASSRDVVRFDWNAATGELSFRTTSSPGLFGDVAPLAQGVVDSASSCRTP